MRLIGMLGKDSTLETVAANGGEPLMDLTYVLK